MTIGILHHIGGGNLGDDATFDAVMDNIKTRWPDAAIVALSMNPQDTESRHGVPAYPLRRRVWSISSSSTQPAASKRTLRSILKRIPVARWLVRAGYTMTLRYPIEVARELVFLAQARRWMKDLDLLVIGGGGQMTERDGAWAFPYTLWKWTSLAKSCRVPCVFLNIGVGPISRTWAKFFSRRALSIADYVSFRDTASQMLARKIGYSGPSYVFPDIAYSLNPPRVAPQQTLHAARPIVGFSGVSPGEPADNPHDARVQASNEILIKSCAVLDSLLSRGFSVRLFGTDIGVDGLANEGIVSLLRQSGTVALPTICAVNSVSDLLNELSEMDYVITCRLHGIIFAHLLNKPVLAISSHPKTSTLMENLGMWRYCVDLKTFDPKDVIDRFTTLVGEKDVIKHVMSKRLAENQAKISAEFDALFSENQTHTWRSASLSAS